MNDQTDAEKSEERLVSRLRGEHRRLYTTLKEKMETYLLDFTAMHIRYFTNHGRKHFLGVIHQMSEMLTENVLANMSSTEVFILLCSAWLHDVGLMVNVDRSGRALHDAEIRDRHPELGRDLIKAEHHEFGLDDRVLAGIVADVGYCHSRKVGSLADNLDERDVFGTDVIRPQFLSAILRLADALDTDSRRAPVMLLQRVAHFPLEARLHWEACQMLHINYDHNQRVIRIRGDMPTRSDEFQTEEYRRLFYWKFHDLYDEFAAVRDVLSGNGLPYHDIVGVLTPSPGSGRHKERVAGSTLSPNNVMPLDVIRFDHYRRLHEERHEYIFAADWCYQAGRLCQQKDDLSHARKWYREASRFAETARKQNSHNPFWWRVLEIHYYLKARETEGGDVNESEQVFLKELDAIQGQLCVVEENLESVRGHVQLEILHLLLKAGHSPKRECISAYLSEWAQKVESGGTLDKCCTYCTGLGVSIWSLSGDIEKAKKGLNWLLMQRDREWRVRDNRKTDFNDTAYAMVGMLDSSSNPTQDETLKCAYELLLNIQSDWEELRQDLRIESYAIILYAIGAYLHRLSPVEPIPGQSILIERYLRYLDEIRLDGSVYMNGLALRGIVSAVMVNQQLSEEVDRIKSALVDFLWDRRETDLADRVKNRVLMSTNPEKTAIWLWGWMMYWEFKLQQVERETGKLPFL